MIINIKEKINITYNLKKFRIELFSKRFGRIVKEGVDFLDSYKKIQFFLEEKGFLICLNGSRIDINSSGFLRDSSNGLLTYLLSYDFMKEKDILNIFDICVENIGTIKDQIIYFENWKKEFKRNNPL